jgi:L-seryl-tRNA(Ser) seleniumtransferase
MRSNPLTRALRVDKLTLAALEATLALYREPERAVSEIPALAMITAPVEQLRDRAKSLAKMLASRGIDAAVVETDASVGGGAFPTARIPSAGVALGGAAAAIEARLRTGEPPVVARIADGRVVLDLRTIPPLLDDVLPSILARAVT